jgi:hypothetical protein
MVLDDIYAEKTATADGRSSLVVVALHENESLGENPSFLGRTYNDV